MTRYGHSLGQVTGRNPDTVCSRRLVLSPPGRMVASIVVAFPVGWPCLAAGR